MQREDPWKMLDALDASRIGYLDFVVALKCWSFVLLVAGFLVWNFGLPHVQGNYVRSGPKPPGGWTPAERKVAAEYWGPLGKRSAQAGEFGPRGCPFVLFFPLEEFTAVPRVTREYPYLVLKERNP